MFLKRYTNKNIPKIGSRFYLISSLAFIILGMCLLYFYPKNLVPGRVLGENTLNEELEDGSQPAAATESFNLTDNAVVSSSTADMQITASNTQISLTTGEGDAVAASSSAINGSDNILSETKLPEQPETDNGLIRDNTDGRSNISLQENEAPDNKNEYPEQEQYFDQVEFKIETVEEGKGEKTAGLGSLVTVILNEKIFNTSKKINPYRTAGKTPTFQLGSGELIAGLDEGIQGMKEGGIRNLIIPAEKAYGLQGNEELDVRPGTALEARVILLNIN